MTIVLSQRFSPAMLVASVLSPGSDRPARLVRTRSPDHAGRFEPGPPATARNRLLDTIFGLSPMPEERPYAL